MKFVTKIAALSLLVLLPQHSSAQLSLAFKPADEQFAEAAREYTKIWSDHGSRIRSLLEQATGASLHSEHITAIVLEDVSYSGVAGTPMRLRASYASSVKRATLVHELSHRYLDALNLDETCFDDIHDVVSLLIAGVWEELWGPQFLAEQARVEMNRSARYAQAWAGVLDLTRQARAKKLAGILSSCQRPATD